MSTLGARRILETTNPETVNYYLRFGWKLLQQYPVPATEDSPEKIRYVLASIAGLEDTRRLVAVEEVAAANGYLELGWRLVDKFVTTVDQPNRRQEQIHFVLAWQRDEEPPTPGTDAPRLIREHVTTIDASEAIEVEP